MTLADTWRKVVSWLRSNRHPDDVYCPVFGRSIDAGVCAEVDSVVEGDIPVESVPKLDALMKEKGYTIEDVKRLHTREGH